MADKKIILLGDSVLKGVVYNEASEKYNVIPWKDEFEDLGYETVNRCRMGATLQYCHDSLRKLVGTERLDSTVVILEYGGNDCDFNWDEVSDAPEAEHSPKTSPDVFASLYSGIINELKALGAKVYISNLAPIDFNKYFDNITKNRKSENILKWLGDKSMLGRWQEYYNGIVEKIARDNGCALIDIRGEFLRSHAFKELLSEDGIHPTQNGHELLRKKYIEALSAV